MLEAVLWGGTVLCAVANVVVVGGKVSRADWVLDNVREVGVPERLVPLLAVLEGAGVVGLVAGLAGLREAGLAAAAGLTSFFVGAVVAHLRARVLHTLGFPLAFLALAVAAMVHFTR